MAKGKGQKLSTLDPTVNGCAAKGPGSELVGIGDHMAKLRQVAATTQTLAGLLGGQLQELLVTIPILRGFELVCSQLPLTILA